MNRVYYGVWITDNNALRIDILTIIKSTIILINILLTIFLLLFNN